MPDAGTTTQSLHPDAETLGTFIASWDSRTPHPRAMADYVRVASLILKTFMPSAAED